MRVVDAADDLVYGVLIVEDSADRAGRLAGGSGEIGRSRSQITHGELSVGAEPQNRRMDGELDAKERRVRSRNPGLCRAAQVEADADRPGRNEVSGQPPAEAVGDIVGGLLVVARQGIDCASRDVRKVGGGKGAVDGQSLGLRGSRQDEQKGEEESAHGSRVDALPSGHK